jgi:NAD(P)H-hydrate repair Nnr-like enzyme with NAD(P)H-hydrate epimerase domain
MDERAFRTGTGRQVPAVTAAEMREVDRVAVEEFGVSLLQMMENAGRNLARHVREVGAGPVVVLAGNGGNGGGGLCGARHLRNRDRGVGGAGPAAGTTRRRRSRAVRDARSISRTRTRSRTSIGSS